MANSQIAMYKTNHLTVLAIFQSECSKNYISKLVMYIVTDISVAGYWDESKYVTYVA